jgi:hypothetical protein
MEYAATSILPARSASRAGIAARASDQVRYLPDRAHLLAVELPLWELSDAEWLKVLRRPPYAPWRSRPIPLTQATSPVKKLSRPIVTNVPPRFGFLPEEAAAVVGLPAAALTAGAVPTGTAALPAEAVFTGSTATVGTPAAGIAPDAGAPLLAGVFVGALDVPPQAARSAAIAEPEMPRRAARRDNPCRCAGWHREGPQQDRADCWRRTSR